MDTATSATNEAAAAKNDSGKELITINEKDFVELDYTGKVVETGEVFDTTSAEVARQNGLFDERTAYQPVVVCVGERHLLIGLDKQLVGKEVGKSYIFRLAPEEAFGRKDAKLLQLISTAKFRQQDLKPVPGLQVNVDGVLGVVRTVTGGRTIVDFNHPLAGKELEYMVTVKRIVTEASEKVKAMLRLLGINTAVVSVNAAEGNAVLEFDSEVPEQLRKDIEAKLKSTIEGLKAVSFVAKVATDKTQAPQLPQQPSQP